MRVIFKRVISLILVLSLLLCSDSCIKVLKAQTTIDSIMDTNEETYEEDKVEKYHVFEDGTMEFQSSMGPYYMIDFVNGDIVECSCGSAKLISCEVSESGILTLKIISSQMPVEKTYVFDVSSPGDKFTEDDAITEYTVSDGGRIIFDSLYGPYYHIDYINKSIISCTSEGAKIIDCILSEDYRNLKLTVWSNERPVETTYEFDLTQIEQKDKIRNYTIYADGVLKIEFTKSPYCEIDYLQKKVLVSSSDYCELKRCELTDEGKILELTLFSNQVPMDRAFSIDMTKNCISDFYYSNNSIITEAPYVTASPVIEVSPGLSPLPDVSVSSDVNPTPYVSVSPDVNPTPYVSVSPDVNPTPGVSVSPDSGESPGVSVGLDSGTSSDITPKVGEQIPVSNSVSIGSYEQKTETEQDESDKIRIKKIKCDKENAIITCTGKLQEKNKICIYRQTKAEGKYKKIATVKKFKYTDHTVEAGYTYYYKIGEKGSTDLSDSSKIYIDMTVPEFEIKKCVTDTGVKYLQIMAKKWSGDRIGIEVKAEGTDYKKVPLKDSKLSSKKNTFNLSYSKEGKSLTFKLYTYKNINGKVLESRKVYMTVNL